MSVTAEQTETLRERILQALADREPRVHGVEVTILRDGETDDESTAVDLTLADPPRDAETRDLDQLNEIALVIEKLVAEEDLPSAVVSVTPESSEDFEDTPKDS